MKFKDILICMALIFGVGVTSVHGVQAEKQFKEVIDLEILDTKQEQEQVDEHPYTYINMTRDEFELLARCVETEAGNQSLLGRQLVVDTIFNRVRSEEFPNTVQGVINQRGQYCARRSIQISSETYEAIELEYDTLVNMDVVYFRTGRYHKFGNPVVKEDDHYFSSL